MEGLLTDQAECACQAFFILHYLLNVREILWHKYQSASILESYKIYSYQKRGCSLALATSVSSSYP